MTDLYELLSGNPQGMTKHFEGYRDDIYLDSEGKRTVGYGFNIDDPYIASMIPKDVLTGKRKIDRKEADEIFNVLYSNAKDDAITYAGGDEVFSKLPSNVQNAIVDMSYNMGLNRLGGFKKMKEAMLQGDFNRMADEMINSKWYGQTGRRSKELVNMVRGKQQTAKKSTATPFNQAFAEARKAGKKVFEFNGKQYTTEVK